MQVDLVVLGFVEVRKVSQAVDDGGDADYTLEDVDEAESSSTSCGIGVQTKGISTAAVPPQCDLTLEGDEDWVAFWFAVRSIAPVAPSGNPLAFHQLSMGHQ